MYPDDTLSGADNSEYAQYVSEYLQERELQFVTLIINGEEYDILHDGDDDYDGYDYDADADADDELV